MVDPNSPESTPGAPSGAPAAAAPAQPSQSPDPETAIPLHRLRAIREELHRLELALCGGHQPITTASAEVSHALAHSTAKIGDTAHQMHVPAWLRVTRGESRWPVAVAIVVAILLQVALPDRLTLISRWVLPGLELAVLAVLIVANPTRFSRESRPVRAASLSLTAILSLANAWSAGLLVIGLVAGREGQDAAPLLSTGAAIWLTNIIAFALWYWQFDRGGPAARAHARRRLPDFQFVQMQTPDMAHPDWEPEFVDYLYLSFTNATAFSPTDVMPLSRWAKLTMLAQSLVSLATIALVIARAVNILK
jgi:uncharacterized membrane protein